MHSRQRRNPDLRFFSRCSCGSTSFFDPETSARFCTLGSTKPPGKYMTNLLVPFKIESLGETNEYQPPADRIIEGDIRCRNWGVDSAKDGLVRAGVWESTPGTNRSIKGETWEYCAILAGVVEITED